jgi:hypothetical protein
MYCGESLRSTNTRQQHNARKTQLSSSSSGMLGRMAEGYGSPGPRLFDEGSLRPMTKWIQARQLRESFCHLSHPEIAKQGECLETLEIQKGETTKGAREGYVDSPKNVWCWMQVRVIRRMSPGQSCPQGGRGASRNGGPTRISGETHPKSWYQM